jgi:hypothetical protein
MRFSTVAECLEHSETLQAQAGVSWLPLRKMAAMRRMIILVLKDHENCSNANVRKMHLRENPFLFKQFHNNKMCHLKIK